MTPWTLLLVLVRGAAPLAPSFCVFAMPYPFSSATASTCSAMAGVRIATMGLNLTVGYAGQKSLGHAAFFGIGAYTVAIVMKAGFRFGSPCRWRACCFLIGLVLGFPALRVQTIYLAFATLGFNMLVWLVMRNEEWLTGGTFGINDIARPVAARLPRATISFYYFVLGVTACWPSCCGGCCARPGARPSPRCATTRSAPRAWAWTSRRYTLLAFAIGAVYAGIAGALFASLVEFIEPAPSPSARLS